MKSLFCLVALALALGATSQADAAFRLRLMATSSPAVEIADEDGNGVITYSGDLGGDFTVNVTTGISKPVLPAGGPCGDMDLNSVNVNTGTGGTLTIELTDTDFNPIGVGRLEAQVGGTLTAPTGSLVTFDSYMDPANGEFSTGAYRVSLGTMGPGGVGMRESTLDTVTNPYSLYMVAVITLTGPGSVSFDFETTNCPENQPPIANAGENQTVSAGTTVALDGRGSTDANGDPITFLWAFVTLPEGSWASLDDATIAQPTFFADLPGNYVLSLVVNDGLMDSDPTSVTVTATASAYAVTQVLTQLVEMVNAISPGDLKNPNLQNALTNKIGAALLDIDAGLYAEALAKLKNDILAKTDGCAVAGSPDKNDWILTCAEQAAVYTQVQAAIALLEEMQQ